VQYHEHEQPQNSWLNSCLNPHQILVWGRTGEQIFGGPEGESPNPYPKYLSYGSIEPSAGHIEFIRHESFPGVGHPSTAIVNTTPTACISIESHSIELKLGQFEAKSSFVSLSNVVDGLRTLLA
jgi:hypothetical protein